MKRLLFALLLLLASVAFARVEEYKLVVELGAGGVALWKATLIYDAPIERSSYYIISRISDVNVFANDSRIECETKKEAVGTSIICPNVGARKISYSFLAYDLTSTVGGIKRFYYPFPITTIIEKLSIEVKLPRGAEIVSKEKLEGLGLAPVSPENATITSDGRRIVIRWDVDSPRLGSTIGLSVFYEELGEALRLITLAVVLGSIVLVAILFFSFRKREKAKQLTRVLTAEEKGVVELLLKSPRKQLDQKEIAKRLDVSKAKASRLIKSLASRGIVEVEKRGRRNKVKLRL